jgi:maltose O-acetyltransferase
MKEAKRRRNGLGMMLLTLFRKFEWRALQLKGRLIFGRRVRAHGHFRVEDPWAVSVGENLSINQGVFILGATKIIIGDNVTLSANSMLIDAGLEIKGPYDDAGRAHVGGEIVLEDNVWVCAGAIILAGVRVGANSVIAAGAVVRSDVPPSCLYGGIPARLIRRLGD